MRRTWGVGHRARTWTAGVVVLLVAVSTALLPVAAPSEATAKVRPPNVLLIIADDQTYHTLGVMPAVRALQDRGTTYTHYYDSFPLCCPTRATFLSGQYSHNNGVWDNVAPHGGYGALQDRDNTLPKWLHDGGYRTAMIGKLMNQYEMDTYGVPAGWDLFRAAEGPVYVYNQTWIRDENGVLTTYDGYKTDVYAQLTVDLLDELGTTQPWFLWLAPNAPHIGPPVDPDDPANLGSCSPSDKWRDHDKAVPLSPDPSFNEADVSDKPFHISRLPPLSADMQKAIHEAYTQQLECLRSLDDYVATVVNHLAETGQLADTDIIYVSDNGYAYGEHRVAAGKKLPYSYASHLPLVAAGPDFEHTVDTGPRSSVDMAATIADLAGVTPGHVIDGRSIRTPPDPYRLILHEGRVVGHNSLRSSIRRYFAIRSRYWLYARYRYRNGSQDFEMYNEVLDPNELSSVDDDPDYALVRQRLDRSLRRINHCVGTDCP